jgi:hypothetical protein
MKKMVKLVATFAVMFFAVSAVAEAQGGGGGRGRGPNYATILKDSLHVSEAVAAKADSIVKAYQAKNAELRASANGDMQSVMPKMQELRAQQLTDLKALLTDEQKASFDKILAAMPGRRGGGGR